jgi:nucleotide-binding universal stress UspA family protein
MYHHLLIPTDGSPLSMEAIQHGVELAQETGATVSFLTVIDPFHAITFEAEQIEDTRESYYAHVRGLAESYLAQAEKVAETAGVKSNSICVEDNHPYRVIIRTAEEHACDLIVMASHGRRGISALVLGSETVKVLTHCAIPVLVYRLPPTPAHRSVGTEHRADQARVTAVQ